MSAFLKSIDSRTWKAVLRCWEHPVTLDKDGNNTTVLKPEEEWTTAEDELVLGNSKALNALFNGVDKNMFRLLKQCNVAKDAWEILKTAHEGTSKENIHDYHLNILDIANSFDSLGEKISDEKLVRKILRSLPKRFKMKVTAIEEAQDISSLKVDEFIESLQKFEININNKTDKKGKDIVFVSDIDTEETQGELEDNESLSEAIVLLGRQFNKILKQAD